MSIANCVYIANNVYDSHNNPWDQRNIEFKQASVRCWDQSQYYVPYKEMPAANRVQRRHGGNGHVWLVLRPVAALHQLLCWLARWPHYHFGVVLVWWSLWWVSSAESSLRVRWQADVPLHFRTKAMTSDSYTPSDWQGPALIRTWGWNSKSLDRTWAHPGLQHCWNDVWQTTRL